MYEGFINVLKPPGMSSHDVISFLRMIFGQKKIGHAGTLDPGAAGVLPVALGQTTRLLEYLADTSKEYRVEIFFGAETDTGDDTGKIIKQDDRFFLPQGKKVVAAMQQLTGFIQQTPSVFSAIKIKGQRACDLARQNIAVELPAREVEISKFSLLAIGSKHIMADVVCSKGTYIRSLCVDLGRLLGLLATMGFLLRKRVGAFSLQDSLTLEEIAAIGEDALLKPDHMLSHLPAYHLAEDRIKPFINGLSTHDPAYGLPNIKLLRVYGHHQFLGIGIYDYDSQCIIPNKVLYHALEQ